MYYNFYQIGRIIVEKLKRYIIFCIGLFLSSFGVSLITKASLGTSPISSIPYVLSLKYTMTLGQFTILFSILLVILQILILLKRFQPASLLQIPVSVLFGYFIDFTMSLLGDFTPSHFMLKMMSLLLGCAVLALGVYFEIIADVVMLPGEAFVRAITMRFETDFGTTKVYFDGSMTVIAILLSFICMHELTGVGIGTIIAALIVGIIAKRFHKRFVAFEKLIFQNHN